MLGLWEDLAIGEGRKRSAGVDTINDLHTFDGSFHFTIELDHTGDQSQHISHSDMVPAECVDGAGPSITVAAKAHDLN